ncbi:phosphotransferase enzyme family protein [Streptomyces litchfieldiae]|uniref:Aminoglycoside phosphotransferase family protein n=1 Tax=Streptomyces litchfieldiae TaxID=3075543 RepID=A0ABU2MW65_9ACTN|nr:aminoglycoside phosphotransferase family protein [Streptomyces sp. DSM 44938]MDT0345881.1 aminoglycoside phosphotransferase family protein [Streptomyces sp. DSM 44938]
MPLDAPAIAAAFGLGQPLGEPRPLANGDNPSVTRLLTTDRGRWVVKTDELLGDWWHKRAERTHRLESAALAAGIPMPRPVEPPAPAVGYWHHPAGEELVRVSEWVEGEELRVNESDPAGSLGGAAGWLGTTLGRVALLGLAGSGDPDEERPLHPVAEWHEWVAQAETAGLPIAGAARSLLPVVEDATALIADALREGPRTVLVHGDTSRANLLSTPDGYVLIDWDAACAEVPWWAAVDVAFRFATPFNGPVADGDPRVVRPLIEGYLGTGAPAGPADVSAFAGMLRSQLSVTAWCLWLALGHRGDDPERRAFGARLVTMAADGLPGVLRSLDGWTALLR